MSSTIYNHRTLQPTAPPTAVSVPVTVAAPGPAPAPPHHPHPGAARLDECLDTVRREFELVSQDINSLRGQRDEYESKISGQVTELNAIHSAVYDLEARYNKMKQSYDEEVARLRAEINATRQGLPAPPPPDPVRPPPLNVSDSLRQPPGLSANDVRGANPPPGYAYPDYGRDRAERERMMDRERERDRIEREREVPGAAREGKRGGRDRKNEYYPPPPKQSAPVPGSPHTISHPSYHAPPPHPSPHPPQQPQSGYATSGSYPDEFDPALVPPELKKEGPDWCAVFSKHVPQRRLDVNLVHTLDHESVVCCVRFSADGKYLATGCNRTAQIYDTKTGAKTCVLVDEAVAKSGADLYIRSLCFSPDGKYLATGAEDKTIRIWDIARKSIRHIFEGHEQEIYSLDFSRDGRLIVSGSGDKTARIWDMDTGQHKALLITEPAEVDAGVTSVAISPDGRLVAAGSLDTIVRLWDSQSGALIERLIGHTDSVYSVAFTPDGRGLVSGSLDQTLKHWDLSPLLRNPSRHIALRQPYDGTRREQSEKGCACTVNFTGHKDYVLSVAVSHDSQWVVSGSKDRCVQFWDLRTAQAQLMLQGHKNSVISIDLSPTGGMLATGSGDCGARLWSYTTLQ